MKWLDVGGAAAMMLMFGLGWHAWRWSEFMSMMGSHPNPSVTTYNPAWLYPAFAAYGLAAVFGVMKLMGRKDSDVS